VVVKLRAVKGVVLFRAPFEAFLVAFLVDGLGVTVVVELEESVGVVGASVVEADFVFKGRGGDFEMEFEDLVEAIAALSAVADAEILD